MDKATLVGLIVSGENGIYGDWKCRYMAKGRTREEILMHVQSVHNDDDYLIITTTLNGMEVLWNPPICSSS